MSTRRIRAVEGLVSTGAYSLRYRLGSSVFRMRINRRLRIVNPSTLACLLHRYVFFICGLQRFSEAGPSDVQMQKIH